MSPRTGLGCFDDQGRMVGQGLLHTDIYIYMYESGISATQFSIYICRLLLIDIIQCLKHFIINIMLQTTKYVTKPGKI